MARRDSDSHERRKAATGILRVAALLLCCACADPPASAPVAAGQEAPFPGFALRGRVDQPLIGWTAPEDLRPAVRKAASLWNSEAGQHPRFVERKEGEAIDLEIDWRRGAHDQCMPFGTESSVAHSGPLPLPSFIHLDLDRDWDDERRVLTLAHELGHILGLAHSADSRALMFAEPSGKKPALTDMDRRGLRTLYGSEEAPTANDLVIAEEGGQSLVLRGVAPVGESEFGLADVDGDGTDELVVWRTDEAGFGALSFYFFAPADKGQSATSTPPLVTRTLGPLYGLYAPGALLSVALEDSLSPTPLLVLEWPDGRYGARPMHPSGRPAVRKPGPLRLRDGRDDMDGDGVFDDSGDHDALSLSLRLNADLNENGTDERVRRP